MKDLYKSIDVSEEPGSVLGAFVNKLKVNSDLKYNLMVGIEASLAVLISVYFSLLAGIEEAGLASLALASSAIVPRVNQILRFNRERIWIEKMSGWIANRKSIVSGGAILIAMAVTYSLVASFLEREVLVERFTFIGANYPDELLTPERFEDGMNFFIKNSKVLLLFFILSFIFRGLGTSLALGWNAGVWSVTIALMVRTGLAEATNPVGYSLNAILAIFPHLLIEGLAYITASLAGIFISRGLTKYFQDGERLQRVFKAVITLIISSFIILALAALTEHYWAPWILR